MNSIVTMPQSVAGSQDHDERIAESVVHNHQKIDERRRQQPDAQIRNESFMLLDLSMT